MKRSSRWRGLLVAVGLLLALQTGCQTWTSGMTLPSPWYLEHTPQYFPPSPTFPLSRELARQEAINNSPVPGAGPLVPLPPRVPPGGAPGVGP